jgi:large subunit ribosomal protein L20
VFKLAKGFNQRGKNNYRITANRVDHALMYAYRDRRNKKRVARQGWISQINAATRQFGINTSLTIYNSSTTACPLTGLGASLPLS